VEKKKTLMIFIAMIFVLGSMTWPFGLPAEENSQGPKGGEKAIQKELEGTLGMPILKGDIWQKMTPDSKVAFLWGVGHVVAIEQHLMEKYQELKTQNFCSKAAEGMVNIPMNEVVARIDNFYNTNPDEIEKPVMSVLWATSIKPNIKTGIAGHPLKNP
jgi:hypothetical protein